MRASFPVGLPVGYFLDTSGQSFPVLLHESNGGFITLCECESKSIALIENSVLKLVEFVGLENSEIVVFDFSIRKKFHYLSRLSNYKVLVEPEEAFRELENLKRIMIYRHHKLFNDEITTLIDYNRNSEYPEKYYFVLMNLNQLPNDYVDEEHLIDFLDAAYEAGFFFFGYNGSNLERSWPKFFRFLLGKYPLIELFEDRLEIFNLLNGKEENVEFYNILRQLKELGVEILPLTDEREAVLNRIVEKKSKVKDRKGDFLSIPIGTSLDRTMVVNFRLGEESGNYHAFITGNTGTGKTTLLNNIILGIAEKYTAKDIRLFLMDYKEGVEFQIFKNHPNVEKIFLDNEDLEAAIALLEEFVSEINRRASIFRRVGVTNIESYNQRFSQNRLPRLILVIDEVHRLFSGSWEERDYFNNLLRDVVRRGRAFGVHLILSTQTLEGVDIDRDIMEQITLRISFKLSSQTASEKIFTWGNTAACNLGKYELIYNPDSGNPEANVWVRAYPPREVEEVLRKIMERRRPDECVRPVVVKSRRERKKANLSVIEDNCGTLKIEAGTLGKFDTSSDKELLNRLKTKGLI